MSPAPVCTIIDNPPDHIFDDEITDDAVLPPQIMTNSSESEDESALANNGYELLPQQPEAEDYISVETIDDFFPEENQTHTADLNLYLTQMSEDALRTPSEEHDATISTCPTPHMESDQIEEIKEAMRSVKLPTSAIPDWAKVVPEEEWKAQLIANIKSRHSAKPANVSECCERHANSAQAFVANFNNNH